MADGSVTFVTALDNEQLKKDISKTKQEIEKLQASVSSSQGEQSGIKAQLDAAKEAAKATEAEIEKLKAKLALTDVNNLDSPLHADVNAYAEAVSKRAEQTAALVEQEKLLAQQDKTTDSLDKKYASITEKLNQQQQLLDSANGKLAAQEEALAKSQSPLGSIVNGIDNAGKAADSFKKRINSLIKRVFVFGVVTAALRNLRSWLGDVVKASPEAAAAVAQLRGALYTLAQPIVSVVIPAFTRLIQIITRVVTVIASLISRIAGTTTRASAAAAESLYEQTEALEATGGAAKEAGKQLAAFDEINQLSSNEQSGGGGGSGGGAIDPDFGIVDNISARVDEIIDKIETLMANFKLSFKSIFFDWKDLTSEDILQKIIAGLGAITGAAIGWSIGGIGGAAIGLIIGASVSTIISSLMFNNDGKISFNEVLESLYGAFGAIAGGIIGFSLGGVAGAAIGVAVGASATILLKELLFDSDIISDNWKQSLIISLSTLMGAMIGFSVGGLAGAAIGAVITLSLSLIITEIEFGGKVGKDGTLFRNGIEKFVCGDLGFPTDEEFSQYFKMVFQSSGDASANGYINGFSDRLHGTGWELLGKLFYDVVEFVKRILGIHSPSTVFEEIGENTGQGFLTGLVLKWNAIKSWWNTSVAQYFTAGWWSNLGTTIMNGLIGGLESGINSALNVIVFFINEIIAMINSISIFGGFSISPISFGGINIPRLAEGAVIPANREFLAVLGDQKSGTNIETPLSTMVEAFKQALAEGGGGGAQTINLVVDGRTLATVCTKYQNQMARGSGI